MIPQLNRTFVFAVLLSMATSLMAVETDQVYFEIEAGELTFQMSAEPGETVDMTLQYIGDIQIVPLIDGQRVRFVTGEGLETSALASGESTPLEIEGSTVQLTWFEESPYGPATGDAYTSGPATENIQLEVSVGGHTVKGTTRLNCILRFTDWGGLTFGVTPIRTSGGRKLQAEVFTITGEPGRERISLIGRVSLDERSEFELEGQSIGLNLVGRYPNN